MYYFRLVKLCRGNCIIKKPLPLASQKWEGWAFKSFNVKYLFKKITDNFKHDKKIVLKILKL